MPAFSKKACRLILLLAVLLVPGAVSAGVFTDELGRRVELPDSPQRIVCLTPSLTEIVFALGLGDRVTGVTTWSDYPPEALEKTKVGDYISPNLEQIAALAPDLILANREGNPPWVVEKLEQAGLSVFVTWPGDPVDLPASLELIGRVCGAPESGRAMALKMQGKFDEIAALLKDAPEVPTLLVIGNRPVVSVGGKSFHGKLLDMVRAKNLAEQVSVNWPRLTMEFVIEAQPEVVIVSTMERGQNLDKEISFWRDAPGLKGRPGFRVESISSDLLDRPGPRLMQGLEKLARLVHPDRFPAPEEPPR